MAWTIPILVTIVFFILTNKKNSHEIKYFRLFVNYL
ncbi:hypothetical protein IGI89_003350 [Enterococcus sp. AZ141]